MLTILTVGQVTLRRWSKHYHWSFGLLIPRNSWPQVVTSYTTLINNTNSHPTFIVLKLGILSNIKNLGGVREGELFCQCPQQSLNIYCMSFPVGVKRPRLVSDLSLSVVSLSYDKYHLKSKQSCSGTKQIKNQRLYLNRLWRVSERFFSKKVDVHCIIIVNSNKLLYEQLTLTCPSVGTQLVYTCPLPR